MGRLLRSRRGRCPEIRRRSRAVCAGRHKRDRPVTKITPKRLRAIAGRPRHLGRRAGRRARPASPQGPRAVTVRAGVSRVTAAAGGGGREGAGSTPPPGGPPGTRPPRAPRPGGGPQGPAPRRTPRLGSLAGLVGGLLAPPPAAAGQVANFDRTVPQA